MRGAVDADADQLHLLAALADGPHPDASAVVLAQTEVTGAKTNEPATARDLLGELDLHGVTITADALRRYVTDTTGRHLSAVAQLGVASHTPDQAGSADLAACNRGQWAIEALHWIRDTCYREDHSRVRTRSGPRILASLRNLAINALRLAGRPDTTEATRWASRNMTRPFTILELTS